MSVNKISRQVELRIRRRIVSSATATAERKGWIAFKMGLIEMQL